MDLGALFTHAVALSALAVVAIQQFLKWKVIPVKFANKYPVPTLIVLSILASALVDWQGGAVIHTWGDFVLQAALVAVSAALTYRTTLKNWDALRATESQV